MPSPSTQMRRREPFSRFSLLLPCIFFFFFCLSVGLAACRNAGRAEELRLRGARQLAAWPQSPSGAGDNAGACAGGASHAPGGLVVGADGQAAVSSVVIASCGAGAVESVELTVSLQHSWADDVYITLSAPDGRAACITRHNGGPSDLRGEYLFSDRASQQLTSNSCGDNPLCIIPPGLYKAVCRVPDDDGNILGEVLSLNTIFGGADPNGAWTVQVSDEYLGADTGVLESWAIRLTLAAGGPAGAAAPAPLPSTGTLCGGTCSANYSGSAVWFGSGQTSSQVVLDSCGVTAVGSVELTLDLQHLWAHNVHITLTAPNGRAACITRYMGAFGTLNGTYSFSDRAAVQLPSSACIGDDGCRITPGLYQAVCRGMGSSGAILATPTSLDALFRGSDPNGAWELTLQDLSPEYGSGVVRGWGIAVACALAPPPAPPAPPAPSPAPLSACGGDCRSTYTSGAVPFGDASTDTQQQAPVTLYAQVASCGIAAIGSIELTVNLQHTWGDDVHIWLTAPNGATACITRHSGGPSNFDGQYVFSDNTTNRLLSNGCGDSGAGAGCLLPPGVYQPVCRTFDENGTLVESVTKLDDAFGGSDPNGVWILEVLDEYPEADSGTLLDWGVRFPCPAPPSPCGPCNKSVHGEPLPFGGQAGEESAPIVSIVDMSSCTTASIGSLDITLDLHHTVAADVYATLTAPDGTAACITRAMGGSWEFDGQYTFSDSAASPVPSSGCGDRASCVIPSGSYRPVCTTMDEDGNIITAPVLLSEVFRGVDARGAWALRLQDEFSAADPGVLRGWSLQVSCGAQAAQGQGTPGLTSESNSSTPQPKAQPPPSPANSQPAPCSGDSCSGHCEHAYSAEAIAFGVGAEDVRSQRLTLNVTGCEVAALGSLSLTVQLRHTWADDVYITLTAPNGASACITRHMGGSSDLDGAYTFTDNATAQLSSQGCGDSGGGGGCLLDPGVYRAVCRDPTQVAEVGEAVIVAVSLSEVFRGADPNGVWAVTVQDEYPDADPGVLRSWSLRLWS